MPAFISTVPRGSPGTRRSRCTALAAIAETLMSTPPRDSTMPLGHQPLVGDGADDEVDAVKRPLEGVGLVEVDRPEIGAGIGPPAGPDAGPARRAERPRDRRPEHPLTAEHEHPAGARPADVRHRPPSRSTLSYTARL